MSDENKINITGEFQRYITLNNEPYYVFTDQETYLMRCLDFPSLVGRFEPNDIIAIECELGERCKTGVILENVVKVTFDAK